MDVVGLVSGLLSMTMADALGVVGLVVVGKWVFGRISAATGK